MRIVILNSFNEFTELCKDFLKHYMQNTWYLAYTQEMFAFFPFIFKVVETKENCEVFFFFFSVFLFVNVSVKVTVSVTSREVLNHVPKEQF